MRQLKAFLRDLKRTAIQIGVGCTFLGLFFGFCLGIGSLAVFILKHYPSVVWGVFIAAIGGVVGWCLLDALGFDY